MQAKINFHAPNNHERAFNTYGYSRHDAWKQTNQAHNLNNQFNRYSAQNFHDYFETQEYSEQKILQERNLYMSDEFVKYAQTYQSYSNEIQKLYNELKSLNAFQKAYRIAKGTYYSGLQKRIRFLYNKLNQHKDLQQINKSTDSLISKTTYQKYTPYLAQANEKRFQIINDNNVSKTHRIYNLSNSVDQLLKKYGHETSFFTQCVGSELQHTLHQESLDILHHINCLPFNSLLHDHQETLVNLTASIADYNHAGLIDKSMNIADLCWTLLDYSQAIAEGVIFGVNCAIEDIITNPLEVTASLVIGKHVLAFQLSKVLYNVAEIGITATVNFDKAQKKWNDYIEPLSTVIDGINNKEITVRDAIKNGTALAVNYKIQSKLLGTLGKFYTSIKQKSINFVKNNSLLTPQQYFATPEGLLLKATAQSTKLKQYTASSLKNSIDGKIHKRKSIKRLIKQEGLPTRGKLRYVPPKKLHSYDRLPFARLSNGKTGFLDRFGNIWAQGDSRTQGEKFEWDVQLSRQGIQQVGWMTKNNTHLNVSLNGRVTHK